MKRLPALLVIAVGTAAASLIAVSAARAANLVGHQAVYSVRLGKASTSSQIIGVDGASMMRLERACDGWIASERLSTVMETLSGVQISRDVRFTGWESFDGRKYRFASRSRTHGNDKAYRGTAEVDAERSGTATFTDPEHRVVDLPKGTRFYVGFTRWILDMAASGKHFAETVTFDGADGDGPQRVTLFVTKAKPPKHKLPDLGELGKGPAYTARMAFYDIGSPAEEPAFEIQARLLANGVATRLSIEFSDFSIIEEIRGLESVPQPTC